MAAKITPHFSFTRPPVSTSSCSMFSFAQANVPANSFVDIFSSFLRIRKRNSVGFGLIGVLGGTAVSKGW